MLRLKGSGLSQGTLESVSYKLRRLSKSCDLHNPEEVKYYIANLNVASSYKQSFVKAYAYFAAINEIRWNRPKYNTERRLPVIPTRENIMKIISASRKYSIIFKILMETGVMPYELSKIERRDIDFEREEVVLDHIIKKNTMHYTQNYGSGSYDRIFVPYRRIIRFIKTGFVQVPIWYIDKQESDGRKHQDVLFESSRRKWNELIYCPECHKKVWINQAAKCKTCGKQLCPDCIHEVGLIFKKKLCSPCLRN